MRRGVIWEVNLEPVRGSEANKRRPAVIVSNDAANATERTRRGVVTVVPVTSNVARLRSFQVLLPKALTGLKRDSKAQAEQVRSVAVEKIGRRLGYVPRPLMTEIDDALRLHLAL